jgi:hypothetical protein
MTCGLLALPLVYRECKRYCATMPSLVHLPNSLACPADAPRLAGGGSARPPYGCAQAAGALSARQLAQPSLEKPPLRLLPRETEGTFVGGAGFRRSPHRVRACITRDNTGTSMPVAAARSVIDVVPACSRSANRSLAATRSNWVYATPVVFQMCTLGLLP